MFERLISIDWSGAGLDDERVGLRIAYWTKDDANLVLPPSRRRARSWSRNEALNFLTRELHPDRPRTAVILDFAFGLPFGSDTKLFRVEGWRPMIRALRDMYHENSTARETAIAINNDPDFQGHGPYRFNDSRGDFRFYLHHGVPYYRMIELVMPQAISVWYVGSGATVGFHTITGLVCLANLLDRRDEGLVNFTIWPHEGMAGSTSGHVLLEGYPAAYPRIEDYGPCQDQDERDAWRMLEWMRVMNADGRLEHSLQLPANIINRFVPDGLRRVQFEGWISGVL